MYSPHTATLYRLTEANDGTTTVDITVLHYCFLQRSESASATTRGLSGADAATLFIPSECTCTDGISGTIKTFATLKDYNAAPDKTGLFTVAEDGLSYYVLGEHIEAGATFKALNAKYGDCYKVTGVRNCDYGSESMRHLEVSGA